MSYRHFFWDFDGTLYNTYGRITRASVKALEDAGAAASFDEVYPVVKRSLFTVWRTWAEPLGMPYEEFHAAYHAHSEEESPESIRPYPGAREALEAALRIGGSNYIYTHRGESLMRWLRYDGLDGLFSDFVTSLDGFPTKPAPDALNYLVSKHGLPLSQCVMIGDRDIDLNAGKNAGMDGALFDPENYYPDYPTPWRFRDFESLKNTLMKP